MRQEACDEHEHAPRKLRLGKLVAEIGIGILAITIFLAAFVNPDEAIGFLWNVTLIWCPLTWVQFIPAWLVGWVILKLVGQIRSSRKPEQNSAG